MKRAIAIGLVVATLVVYGAVAGHEFITYDDAGYVYDNPNVQRGLTPATLAWAFTSSAAANWHPLTWISHIVDWQLYGPRAGGHHVTSLLLHLASVLLLFLALDRMTGATARSGFVAALFAIHPAHVESVAWVAERKDVLSTLFMMLGLLAYVRYVEKPVPARFAWVVAALAAGLMAKPMLVTFPLLLLLLDHWPLGRSGGRALVIEKLPLFALAAGSSVVTFWAQARGGAVKALEELPLLLRAENAIVSYVRYVGTMLWPSHLAIFYPHPRETLPPWEVALAALALGAATWLAFRLRAKHPYLVTGWLWYVIALLPVIGLVQIGDQARADRYTYVPLIGLFVVVAWGVPEIPHAGLRARRALAAIVLVALGLVAWRQVSYWKNTRTLFEHALAVTSGNFLAHQVLGDLDATRGRLDGAIAHYEAALTARPTDRIVHNNLSGVLYLQGNLEGAERHAREAIRLDPSFARAHNALGLALAARGEADAAIAEYRAALASDPDNAASNYNLGLVLYRRGELDEAIERFRRVIEVDPGQAGAYGYLASALAAKGDRAGAERTLALARSRGLTPKIPASPR